MYSSNNSWNPTAFLKYITHFSTSTGVALIKTDKTEGYIKPLGNREGPHALAREFIGTSIAEYLGIRTLKYGLLYVTDIDEIPLGHDRRARSGPAFITKREKGISWSGSKKYLENVENKEDIAKMVVLDTLILNHDRFAPPEFDRPENFQNVFLAESDTDSRMFCITAIDHTHCLKCGSDLGRNIADIDFVKDEKVYGAFPAFCSYIRKPIISKMISKLDSLNYSIMERILSGVPNEWEVNEGVKKCIADFVVNRCNFLTDRLEGMLLPLSSEQGNLNI